jgi:RNA polymerase sigma factor (sigma-70 family)
MVSAQLGSVLGHIHRLAAAPDAAEPSDGQLMERFVRHGEEAAFTALVRRHGPMVLGVCRRVLRDCQRAEDAFQATFLVLFRKARSLDRRGSVAGWLYTVAYHAALKARSDAARRERWERKAAERPHPEPNAEAPCLDLQPVLDEELGRLPEHYRVAIVLCYFEGKTNEEAARLLGCQTGTIKSRLARARDLLRVRLSRRGVTLSATALLATLATEAVAAVPLQLVASTVRTALGGTVSATRAAILAEGVLRVLSAARFKTGALVILSAGLVLLGAMALARPTLAKRPSGAPAQPEMASVPARSHAQSKPADPETRTITGQVLDPDSKPVAGARVAVVVASKRPPLRGEWFAARPDIPGQARADADGRFRLRVPRSPIPSYRVIVVAAAVGRGLGWHDVGEDGKEAPIRLLPDQILRGRLLDLQGQPAAGVQVLVRGAWPKGPAPQGLSFQESPEESPVRPRPVTTDAEGRFTLRGLGRGLAVDVEVRGERIATQMLHFDPQDGEVTRTLAAAQTLEGTIRYADTNKPVPGARLFLWTAHATNAVESRSDAQGRFRLNPYPGPSFTLFAYAPDGEPYLSVKQELAWPKGAIRHQVRLALPRGVLVRGTLTEAPSGRPVTGASIQYFPRLTDNLRRQPEIVDEWAGAAGSGPEGAFRFVVPPGPGHLLVKGPTADYIHLEVASSRIHYNRPGGQRWRPDAVIPLNLEPGTRTADVKATLRRGVTIHGRVLDPDGKPVARARMACPLQLTPFQYHWQWSFDVRDGRFELHGCESGKAYPVYFLGAEHRLGAAAMITAQESDEPVVVRLTACGSATVRFVDAHGMPLVGHSPWLVLVLTPGAHPTLDALDKGRLYADEEHAGNLARPGKWNLRSDAEGRVTLPALIPGATYRIVASERVLKEFKAESGKVLKLEDVVIGASE